MSIDSSTAPVGIVAPAWANRVEPWLSTSSGPIRVVSGVVDALGGTVAVTASQAGDGTLSDAYVNASELCGISLDVGELADVARALADLSRILVEVHGGIVSQEVTA